MSCLHTFIGMGLICIRKHNCFSFQCNQHLRTNLFTMVYYRRLIIFGKKEKKIMLEYLKNK